MVVILSLIYGLSIAFNSSSLLAKSTLPKQSLPNRLFSEHPLPFLSLLMFAIASVSYRIVYPRDPENMRKIVQEKGLMEKNLEPRFGNHSTLNPWLLGVHKHPQMKLHHREHIRLYLRYKLEVRFKQRFRKGVGGQRGLAQGNPSHTIDSGLFSAPFFLWPPDENIILRDNYLLSFGRCWSSTPSRQPLFETYDLISPEVSRCGASVAIPAEPCGVKKNFYGANFGSWKNFRKVLVRNF